MKTIRRPDRPLARAVRMNSLSSAPSIAARVMRANGASAKIAIVAAGKMSWRQYCAKRLDIAGQQTIDQVESGMRRRCREEDVEPAERRRRHTEKIVEHVDQQEAGEEGRQ